MIPPAANPPPVAGFEPTWTSIEVFTGEHRLTCEIRIAGRLRTRLLDNEPVLRVRSINTVEASPAMPHLTAVAEGLIWRSRAVAFTIADELPDPDAPEVTARPILLEGNRWTISAQAVFPAGAERDRHLDQLMQARFWLVNDATFTAEWAASPVVWRLPNAYVNVEQALCVYLG